MKLAATLLGSLLALAVCCLAQEPLLDRIDADAARAWIDTEFAANQKLYADNPDILVRRALIANRQARYVEVQGFATGHRDAPIEFFLTTEYGRDYESIAITMAKPSDLHAALVFIGVQPGHTVDYPALRFWPRGERVTMTYRWTEQEAGREVERELRAEKAVFDQALKGPMKETGFVFAGSTRVHEEGKEEETYAADLGGEIVSNFNDHWTVLDLPVRAEQGQVYGSRIPHPDHLFAVGQRLRIRLTPVTPAGQTMVREYRIAILPSERPPVSAADLAVAVTASDGGEALAKTGFAELLDWLGKEMVAGHDVFVTFAYDQALPVRPLQEFAAIVERLIEREIIKLEPDAEHLYHQAWLPQERWRDRQNRILQPIEIHHRQGAPTRVIHLLEAYEADGVALTEEPFTVDGPKGVAELMEQHPDWDTNTLFLYVPPDATYGTVLDYYRPLRERFPILFVFIVAPTADMPAPQ